MNRESQSLERKLELYFNKPIASLRTVDINISGIYIIPDNNFVYHDEISFYLFHPEDRFFRIVLAKHLTNYT